MNLLPPNHYSFFHDFLTSWLFKPYCYRLSLGVCSLQTVWVWYLSFKTYLDSNWFNKSVLGATKYLNMAKEAIQPRKNVCVFNWCPNPRSEYFKTFLFFGSPVREWGLCPGLLSAVLRSKHLQSALPASISGCFFPFCPCFNASKSDYQGSLLFYHPHPWAHQHFRLPFILSPH